ncbi:glycosyltransferase family 4 protein [Roseicitreum antarcticum]|uniref:Glycosyltransferase involved in cell wall bisynthesis n=1 Tax=Roseicitreum antarcticum TaxID=564137 RepID=A0A1H2RFR2_9RHOB|nr:glycosyltransferase family 4 protein [Roseicitreum antarcticum]SDW18286.1 Glycosyltransferase involved in cell wall bisynthesis [Roseicitreum antarcticum]
MRIGYLMNTYPITSTTFIRREMAAHEAMGTEVMRYAIRPWAEPLVDPADQAEIARTQYLLIGQDTGLIRRFLAELLRNPLRVLPGLWMMLRMMAAAGGQVVAHCAYLLEAVSLLQRTRRDGIHHIHTHFSTNSAGVAMLCHSMGGPGYSFTAHGPDEFVNPAQSSLAMKIARARFGVAITEFARVQLALAGGMAHWEKLHVVRCGVDPAEFTPEGAGFNGAPFVCVGRLCPQKAQVLVVRALAQVVQNHPKAQLILIGDGETRAEVEAEVTRAGLSGHVQLLGWQSNAQVRAHLAGARALLLPSFAEGLPIVIMEAMAMGRPVISTYIAGIPELLNADCGWIIPAGSVDAIAGAMEAALHAPEGELEAMGREGRRRVSDLHDVTQNAAQLRALFSEAIVAG